jgi:thioredoxin 1
VKKSDKILTLNTKNFKAATRKGLVLVDFWAPWCAPCKAIAPILNDVAEELDGEVKIGKINVDHNQPVAGKLKVRNIPTMVLFKDGEEVKRFVGVKTRKFLIRELRAQA